MEGGSVTEHEANSAENAEIRADAEMMFDAFSSEWMTPSDWLRAQHAEAARRTGAAFWLRNQWRRVRGKPTLVRGYDLRRGANMLALRVSRPDLSGEHASSGVSG